MAQQSLCLRCLRRSLHSIETADRNTSRVFSLPFSSTAVQHKAMKAKMVKKVVVKRASQSYGKGKRTAGSGGGRPPAPGERKAMRKRVVLSNTNALPVQNLRQFSKEVVNHLSAQEGNVFGFGDATVDALRALDAFKPTQGWSLFRQPATVVRPETIRLVGLLKRAERDGPPAERSSRVVLAGERGSGKSVLQLQAIAAAQLKGWILVHIPEAKDLTIGHTAYQPTVDKDGNTNYIQPEYTAELLGKIFKANESILSKMQLAHTHQFPTSIQSNISLARLVDLGSRDLDLAYPVWKAFLKEVMTAPRQQGDGMQRPPVLLSIDSLALVMSPSHYLDPSLKKIHAHDLALVADFCSYLNGKSEMSNGGVVLASTSASDGSSAPTLNFLLERKIAEEHGRPLPRQDPFVALDSKVEAALRGTEVIDVGGISKNEAKGLMEYYALSGLLRKSVTSDLVGEKWAVSGKGIIGAIERSCVLQRV